MKPQQQDADPRIESLKAEISELKTAISQMRKEGKDAFIAWLKFTNLPSKLKMAEATKTDKDINAVKQKLEEVRQEVRAAQEQEAKNIFTLKAEITKQRAAFDKINSRTKEAALAISQGNKQKAKELYKEIQKLFQQLGQEQKRLVAKSCQELIQRLAN